MARVTPLHLLAGHSWDQHIPGGSWVHLTPDQLGAAFLVAGFIAAAVLAVGSAFTTAGRRLARLAAITGLERVLADVAPAPTTRKDT